MYFFMACLHTCTSLARLVPTQSVRSLKLEFDCDCDQHVGAGNSIQVL